MTESSRWEDAWILLAILYAGRPGEFASLARVIGIADYINHAIPTHGELDGAFDRLQRADWIEFRDLTYAPTEAAESMFADRRDKRTSVRKDREVVARRIGAEEWSPGSPIPTVGPEGPRCVQLTEAAVRCACDEYLATKRKSK